MPEQRELWRDLRIDIAGLPQAQGSKRVVNGRLIDASRNLRPWREHLTWMISNNVPLDWPRTYCYQVSLLFLFGRPKGHFTRRGALVRSAPLHKTTRPDIDKLARAVLDSCTEAGVWRDDCQVVHLYASKVFSSSPPGVTVKIRAMPDTFLQQEEEARR